MPTPNPRYLSKHHTRVRGRPCLSRWTCRRRALAQIAADAPPPPTATFTVTGTPDPDVTGDYYLYGTFNASPTYKHHAKEFYIYKFVTYGPPLLSDAVGNSTYYWFGYSVSWVGYMYPYPPFSGIIVNSWA